MVNLKNVGQTHCYAQALPRMMRRTLEICLVSYCYNRLLKSLSLNVFSSSSLSFYKFSNKILQYSYYLQKPYALHISIIYMAAFRLGST